MNGGFSLTNDINLDVVRRERGPFWIWLSKRMVTAHPVTTVGTSAALCSGDTERAQGSGLRHSRFPDQPLHFSALRGVRRKTTKQVLRCRGRIGAAARARKRDRQPEARLVQIGIDRERSLQWVDGVTRMSAV